MSIRPTRRPLAALAAAGVAAAGLSLVPAVPAHAAPAPLTLQWEISQQFDDHLSTHTLTDGATESADGVITFPGGVGSFDSATGLSEVAYDGAVEGAFVNAGATFYKVTIADPIVRVDATGKGEITAVVSAWNAAAMGSSEESTEPTRVRVTTFDASASDWTQAEGVATLTETPDWVGVLPEGEKSQALGIGAGKPVDGGSFAPEFLAQITSGVRAHFYASAANQPKKAPSSFTASAPIADAPAVRATSVSSAAGVKVTVTGESFRGVTNPGDNGIYVGIARAGGLPDVSDITKQDSFVVATWLSAAQIAEGTFTVDLTAPSAKLDPRLKYAVYTWQAHGHSNTSQDTQTPVAIDWKKLGYPLASTTTAKVAKAPTTKKAGKATIRVASSRYVPGGKVKVVYRGGKLKGKKVKVAKTISLSAQGTATLKLPKSAKGKRTLKVTYLGSSLHKASTKTVKVKVKR